MLVPYPPTPPTVSSAVTIAMAIAIAISHSSAPPLLCDYSVKREPVSITSGALPKFLNGTFFHAAYEAFRTDSKATAGGVISVDFSGAGAGEAVASFGLVKGTDYHAYCGGSPPSTWADSDAVTVNSACGKGNVCAVSAQPQVTALSAADLTTTQAPAAFDYSVLGEPQTPYGPHGPLFFSGAHMPTDADGTSYGCAYVVKPAAAYRIYKVPPGGALTLVADVPATAQPGEGGTAPGPSYNHQSLAFTRSFLLLPEMPLRMPADGSFDWDQIQVCHMHSSTPERCIAPRSCFKGFLFQIPPGLLLYLQ